MKGDFYLLSKYRQVTSLESKVIVKGQDLSAWLGRETIWCFAESSSLINIIVIGKGIISSYHADCVCVTVRNHNKNLQPGERRRKIAENEILNS